MYATVIAQGDEKDNIYNYYTIILMSNDHRPWAALDIRTGGGGVPNIEESTLLISRHVSQIFFIDALPNNLKGTRY